MPVMLGWDVYAADAGMLGMLGCIMLVLLGMLECKILVMLVKLGMR